MMEVGESQTEESVIFILQGVAVMSIETGT
jgi:hypothetical protein